MDYDHVLVAPDYENGKPDEFVLFEPKECTRRRAAFSIIMFIYGFNAIGNLGYYSLLMDKFKLNPDETNFHYTFVSSLFILKPFYGLLTDSCYICGRKRQPYILIAGILASLLWIGMIYFTNTAVMATLLMCLINLMMGMISTTSQALVIEDSREKKEGAQEHEFDNVRATKNISMFFSLDSIALLLSSYLSGYLVKKYSLSTVFLISSIFPFLISAFSFILCESKFSLYFFIGRVEHKPEDGLKGNKKSRSFKQQIRRIWCFVKMREIFLPLIFIFLFTLTPSTYDAMFYFYIYELDFDYEFIGRIQFVASLAMFLGIVIYYNFLSTSPFKKLIIGCTIVASIFYLLQLVLVLRWNLALDIPDTYLSLTLDLATNTLAELQTMPVLLLACKLCPRDLEASIYEVILGIKNLAYMISYRSGGWFMKWLGITTTDFNNLWILIVISSLFPLITLVILIFVPIKVTYKEEFEKLEDMANHEKEPLMINNS